MKIKDIVTDKQLDQAWGHSNFGPVSRRDIVRYTLLKYVCDYGSGHTAQCIVKELGLVTGEYRLTKRGKEYLYEAFRKGSNI